MPHIVSGLLRGEGAPLSYGRQVHDFMHVENAGRAFAMFLLNGAVVGAVNIVTGVGVDLRTVAHKVADMPSGDYLKFGMTAVQNDKPPILIADTKRLRDKAGFRPSYSLEDGLAAMISDIGNVY